MASDGSLPGAHLHLHVLGGVAHPAPRLRSAESGCYATSHELVGYAKVRIEALPVVDIEPQAPAEPVEDKVPEEVAAEIKSCPPA
jgi:hypothetical protein